MVQTQRLRINSKPQTRSSTRSRRASPSQAPSLPKRSPSYKRRRWSASSTTDTDQLKERVQDPEDKVGLLESNAMANESSSNSGVDSQEVAELKKTIEVLTAQMQTVTGHCSS
jgi:hypothetical protein